MKAINRFRKGSGAYRCECCTRLTRATGSGDAAGVRLCEECYEMAGIENLIADSGETQELKKELEQLRQQVIAKGGKL